MNIFVVQRNIVFYKPALHDLLRATSIDGVYVVDVIPKKIRHWISDDCHIRIDKKYIETKKHDIVDNFLLAGGN